MQRLEKMMKAKETISAEKNAAVAARDHLRKDAVSALELPSTNDSLRTYIEENFDQLSPKRFNIHGQGPTEAVILYEDGKKTNFLGMYKNGLVVMLTSDDKGIYTERDVSTAARLGMMDVTGPFGIINDEKVLHRLELLFMPQLVKASDALNAIRVSAGMASINLDKFIGDQVENQPTRD